MYSRCSSRLSTESATSDELVAIALVATCLPVQGDKTCRRITFDSIHDPVILRFAYVRGLVPYPASDSNLWGLLPRATAAWPPVDRLSEYVTETGLVDYGRLAAQVSNLHGCLSSFPCFVG